METINLLGGICSILAFLSALITFILKLEKKTKQFKFVNFCLFMLICLVFIGSLVIIYKSIQTPIEMKHLLWGVVVFAVSVALLLIYAHRAYHSLDNGDAAILPPKLLWQMLFNKIESRITNPSCKHIRFAVVSMDDSDGVKISAEKISKCYSDNELYDIVPIIGYKKSNKSLFNLNNVQKEKDLSGVIFLIGTAADDDLSWKNLKTAIEDFSNERREVPIGYIKSGNKRCFDLHFEEIDSGHLENCIHNLIMRGYARSRMQFELGNAYQSCFWVGIVMFMALCFSILVGKYLYLRQTNLYEKKMEKTVDSIRRALERPTVLPDVIYDENEALITWNNLDLGLVKNDVFLKQTLTDVSEYYFHDLKSFNFVKIWIRNSKESDSLTCVFHNTNRFYKGFNVSIPMDYLVGKVAKYRVFFLWPGDCNLIDSSFNKNAFAWYWKMDDDNRIKNSQWQCDLIEETRKWKWVGDINVDGQWQNAKIEWVKVDKDDFAAFCFSYDGCMVLEIDCVPGELKADYDYMANMMFRNSVRKYMQYVYCLLKNEKYRK